MLYRLLIWWPGGKRGINSKVLQIVSCEDFHGSNTEFFLFSSYLEFLK